MTDPSTSKYTYSPLLPGHRSIRLLRLHPSSVSDAPIQCQLFNYSLTFPRRSFHLYECLSYVWGSSENKQHILIDGKLFNITQNLHAALIRLRDAYIDRIMWVDAICMNQDDVKERTHQVKSMAMIYAYASRVVVWLGEEADESSATMEKIRIEANTRIRQRSWDRISVPVRPDHQKTEECTIENALLSFLRRPWFRRVWVLQEVAAARSLSIVCGPKEISGTCFCLGLEPIMNAAKHEDRVDLHATLSSIIYLMSDTNFCSLEEHDTNETFSIGLRPLSQLIDMFWAREATDIRDKVYSLLGMSTMEREPLLPDYEIDWATAFGNHVRYILGEDVKTSLRFWQGNHYGLISGIGSILGYVSRAYHFAAGVQATDVVICHSTFEYKATCNSFDIKSPRVHWSLHGSALPVREGDILCLLQGALKPTIIRPSTDHFIIVAVAVDLPTGMSYYEESSVRLCSETWYKHFQQLTSKQALLLVWAWDNNSKAHTDHDDDRDHSNFYLHEKSDRIQVLFDLSQVVDEAESKIGMDQIISQIEKHQGDLKKLPHYEVRFQRLQLLSANWRSYQILKLLVGVTLEETHTTLLLHQHITDYVLRSSWGNIEDDASLVNARSAFGDSLLHKFTSLVGDTFPHVHRTWDEFRKRDGQAWVVHGEKLSDNDFIQTLGIALKLWGTMFSTESLLTMEELTKDALKDMSWTLLDRTFEDQVQQKALQDALFQKLLDRM